MGRLEEMLLSNSLIYRDGDYSARVEGSLINNSLVVVKSGRVTHRVERAENGVDLVLVNASTNTVEARLAA